MPHIPRKTAILTISPVQRGLSKSTHAHSVWSASDCSPAQSSDSGCVLLAAVSQLSFIHMQEQYPESPVFETHLKNTYTSNAAMSQASHVVVCKKMRDFNKVDTLCGLGLQGQSGRAVAIYSHAHVLCWALQISVSVALWLSVWMLWTHT